MIEKIIHSRELIKESLAKYEKIAVACSFGKDSVVILHLALSIKPNIPVFTVMTPFKPKETFEYKDYLTQLWNINLTEYFQEDDIGAENQKLWATNPEKCCDYFKVRPTREAVKYLDAWICGLRNTEGPTRQDYQEVEYKGDLVKINPILTWTELDIWKYIAFNSIPVHSWYKNDYRSLGCEPCTVIVSDSEPERSGRWKDTNKCGGECGIHTKILK
ncbi:MAG: phosphoadenylyl-sulfate reductase [Nanoarchaeota archaeon]|nr:phosphoadenylyl-sulfate reductase [Nanoarchaeota archaeon]MBU1854752.1 phosphoadenylyl-sulfate reductase [Nanoarchaeota archaeon]